MTSTDKYHDFLAIDATEHLKNALQHFFTNNHNKYKFSLTKKHYDGTARTSDFTDAKQFFKIIMDTDLVTNKIITLYKTNQGYRYLFKKEYFQQVQRMIRTQKRTQVRTTAENTTPSTTNKSRSTSKEFPRKTSPFLEAMNTLTDTSDDDTQPDSRKTESPILIPDQIAATTTVQTDNPKENNESHEET